MDHQLHIASKEAANVVCVSLDVHLWSGRKRLRKDALLAKNPEFSNLPPESLATLGAIKICDPDDLRPFQRLKRQADTLLCSNGLPLLGTIGIPEAKLDGVYKRLMELQAEFNRTRDTLYRDFSVRIDEWRGKADNKDWAHLISDIPTPEHVAGRLSFGFHMVRVSAPAADEDSPINEHYGQAIGGLKGELFEDAAREARVLMQNYLVGRGADGAVSKREKITQKTLRPLKKVAEKLRSFAFLDSTVEPLAQVIDHCLSLVPQEGPIEGVQLMHIWTLANLLSDTALSQETAAVAMRLGSAESAFEDVLNKASPPAASTTPATEESIPVAAVADAAAAADDLGLFLQPGPSTGIPFASAPVTPLPHAQFEPVLEGAFF